jgi:8-oxo-dGTP pyrophosphatase MutT (NUDIX family)
MNSSILLPNLEAEVISGYLMQALRQASPSVLKGDRLAAVLIPIIKTTEGLSLIYTRRSEKLKNHKGQVSFPGGGADPCDEGPAATALREAQEEIGLPPDNVQILGEMAGIMSSSRYNVTPVVGLIKKSFEIVPNPDEVARVFTVPMDWLSNPKNVDFRDMETPWGRHRNVVFYKEYDGEVVWGFTGLLTVRFLQIIQQLSI